MKRRRAFGLLILAVGVFAAVCGAWLRVQRQQYARNRALITALTYGHTKTALALVNAGADPNTRYVPTPAPSFKLLLDQLLHRASAPAHDTDTALILACRPVVLTNGPLAHYSALPPENVPLVQAMLARGANVNTRGHNGRTALHEAATDNRLRTAELLLAHGANVNAQDIYLSTPLMCAACDDTADTTRLLLARGANVAMQDLIGRTPLYYAVRFSSAPDVLSALLAHGADPNAHAHNGFSPLQLARRDKRFDLVRLLTRGAK